MGTKKIEHHTENWEMNEYVGRHINGVFTGHMSNPVSGVSIMLIGNKGCKIMAYTDDTVVYVEGNTSHILQETAKRVLEYCDEW